MKISRELKTGIIAVIIIALFIWGFNFLKNQSLYDKSNTFYAEYNNVQGLSTASPVTINGLSVGKISKISFHPSKKGVMVVSIQLPNNIQFSKNSAAEIYSPDFISGKSLKINLTYDDAGFAQNGDTLRGASESSIMGMINDQLGPLQYKVESFVTEADSVMVNLNKVLNEDNKKNIKEGLQNLNSTLAHFNGVSAKLNTILSENDQKIDSLLHSANTTMHNFAEISDSLQKADLGASAMKLKNALESLSAMLGGLEKGEGNLGKLLKEEGLYENLENATKELEELLHDFKMHPKRYVNVSVFGKKEKPYVKDTVK